MGKVRSRDTSTSKQDSPVTILPVPATTMKNVAHPNTIPVLHLHPQFPTTETTRKLTEKNPITTTKETTTGESTTTLQPTTSSLRSLYSISNLCSHLKGISATCRSSFLCMLVGGCLFICRKISVVLLFLGARVCTTMEDMTISSRLGNIYFVYQALHSMEWLRTDARRTAVGLDLDKEALLWCTENNINNVGADSYSRIFLFHGNVLHPHKATIVKLNHEDPVQTVALGDRVDNMQDAMMGLSLKPAASSQNRTMTDLSLPGRDIVCAFNYSCCCLHERKQLVLYFKNAHDVLSRKGGIFVMDLYGGTSSEQELRLQRRFPNFTYIWEQEEFDIIQRKTRISLHFHLHKPRRKIRHAFSYSWRLWSLPEVRDCLEEAGFRSVHFWIREMPNTEEHKSTQGFGAAHDLKYEELTRFQQLEAWNAYVVAVA